METVSFTQVGVFIGCITFLLGLVWVVKSLTERNPPLYQEFASKVECEDIASRLDAHIAETARRFDEMTKASSASRAKIYDGLNKAREEIAALAKGAELQNQATMELARKIDRLIERLQNLI